MPCTPTATGSSCASRTGSPRSPSSSPGSARSPEVGRALEELDIRWIGARSPQAKGRIERVWGTFQDRLISELRLARAETLEQANAVLAAYLPRHNRRFAVPAADQRPAWRAMPEGPAPAVVFCFHYPRRVANDATLSWPGGPLQLPRRRDGRSWAGRRVILQERLDGSLWVSHEQALYPVRPAPPDPGQLRARHLPRAAEGQPDLDLGLLADSHPTGALGATMRRPPAADHPWRRRYSRRNR